MKTYSPKPRDIERRWYVIDASGAILGRLASEAAAILRGKHKPIFATHMDTGDHLIVVNAKEVRLTGGKEEKKVAYRHSGYPGGLTETKYSRLLAQKPHWAVEKAIKGMLPKNRLGRAMAKKLQVYPGPDHPHQAQKPQPLKLGEIPRWDGLPKPEAPSASKPKDETTRPAGKPSTAKRTTAKPAAKKSTARSTPKSTAKSTSKSTAKSTAKPTAKTKATSKAKTAAKATTAKSPAKKSTARRSLRRKKEE